MAPFLYRCPNTGRQVQAWAADDPTEDDDAYETVACLACAGIHDAVARLVGIEGGVVSGVFNLESSGVRASDWRPRHDKRYHEA